MPTCMPTYSIEHIEHSQAGHQVSIRVRLGQDSHTIQYSSPDITLAGQAEAGIAAGLLPCMKLRANMQVDAPVSPRFLAGVESIQEVIRSWKPGYAHVALAGAQPQATPQPGAQRVGVFFSTGVDSFYSLLRHGDEITDLIYLGGFDTTVGDWSGYQATADRARRVAEHYGKGFIQVDTNIRQMIEQYAFWGLAHGSAMASIGHLLGQHFRRIYIAASLDLPNQIHWGTHPQLDPCWSSETLEFIHDGSDTRRIDKVARLAQEDIALQTLRVCIYPPGEKLNCGRCEKCVRTMIALRAVNALERCPTFAARLELSQVYRLYLAEDPLHQAFVAENLARLEQTGADPALAAALRRVQQVPRPIKRLLRLARRGHKA